MASNEILAKLTNIAYDDEGTISGWERLQIPSPDNPTGYDGAAFRNPLTNEVIVVSRGTEIPRCYRGDGNE